MRRLAVVLMVTSLGCATRPADSRYYRGHVVVKMPSADPHFTLFRIDGRPMITEHDGDHRVRCPEYPHRQFASWHEAARAIVDLSEIIPASHQ